MSNNISLESTSAAFSKRNAEFRNVDASKGVRFERDGAAFRFSTPTPNEIRVFELTRKPTFLVFTRTGAMLYEPTLSSEAAPVYFPNVDETPPIRRGERRRAANLATSLRTRVYFPAFLENELQGKTINGDNLTLAELAPFRVGDRIAAFWNRAAGRFEALEPTRVDVLRFQTTGPLMNFGMPNGTATATATALYFDAGSASFLKSPLAITVVDSFGKFFGAAVGARGIAKRFADRGDWEILAIYS